MTDVTKKVKKGIIEDAIIEQMKMVYDPEIPVNIYELGLIYDVIVDDDLNAVVVMTLTSPNCPVAESLPEEVKERIELVQDVKSATVELTFEPPWEMSMMSEEAKLELDMLD